MSTPKRRPNLTAKQRAILEHIKHSPVPPTRRELCEAFGWASTNAAASHLKALERKGYIQRLGMKARGIIVL